MRKQSEGCLGQLNRSFLRKSFKTSTLSQSIMKKQILLIIVAAIFTGCNNDKQSDTGVVIKGTLSSNATKSSGLKSTSSLADASKVLVFNSSGGYNLFNISDNSFAAKAQSGTATAIAFLKEDNSYIGCLTTGGLNVLPLVSLRDGENTIIDLSTLTLDGTSVIPANNPIGDEIGLSQEEIDRFQQLGTFFGSLSENIDSDSDGEPDILSNKAIYISTIFDIYCGKWGLDNTPPQINDPADFYVNYWMRVSGGKELISSDQSITLSGPEGNPYSDIMQAHYSVAPDCFIAFFRRETQAPQGYPFGSAFLPFNNGKYTVTLNNKNYSLNYSNVDVDYFFVLAEPTIHTNANNEVVSVSVEYRDRNGELVNPENFVYQTMIQLNGSNHNQISQIGTIWENPEAKTNTELYNFEVQNPFPLSQLNGVTVCYLDLVGNAYNIGYIK
jgi:hypothetical protein